MTQKHAFISFFLFLIVSLLFAPLSWLSLNVSELTQGTFGVEVTFPSLTFNQPVGIYTTARAWCRITDGDADEETKKSLLALNHSQSEIIVNHLRMFKRQRFWNLA